MEFWGSAISGIAADVANMAAEAKYVSSDAEEYCHSLNESTIKKLEEWNTKWSSMLIGLQIYLVTLMILGVFGNSLVIYMYGKKSPKSSAVQFVLFLACIDMFVCVAVIPMALAEIHMQFTFFSLAGCYVYEYVRHVSVTISCIMLGGIAVERYFVVCKPLSSLVHVYRARYALLISVVIALALEFAVFFIYSLSRVTLPDGMEGCQCAIKEDIAYTHVHVILLTVKFLIQLSLAFGVVILYTMVYSTVHRRELRKRLATKVQASVIAPVHCGQGQVTAANPADDKPLQRKELQPIHERESVSSDRGHGDPNVATMIEDIYRQDTDSKDSEDASNVNALATKPLRTDGGFHWRDEVKSQRDDISENQQENCTDKGQETIRANGEGKENGNSFLSKKVHPMDKSAAEGIKSSGLKGRHKTAQMLVLVTLVFFITWIPYWVINFLAYFVPEFYKSMSTWQVNILKIFRHFYFINHVVNPVIYTFVNKQFRTELKHVLLCGKYCKCIK